MTTRRGQQRLRVVREPGLVERLTEELGDLGPAAVERRDEKVGRPLVRELDDPLCEVGLDRLDPALEQGVVEAELVGRQRLHLDDLARARPLDDVDDHGVGLGRIARPVDDSARRGDGRLEPDEQLVEAEHRPLPDRRAGGAELHPVGRLVDDGGAARANRRRCPVDVGPRLHVLERGHRGALERQPRRVRRRRRCSRREHLREMDGAPGRAAMLEPAADVEEARGVAGADGRGAGALDAPELVGEHGGGYVGVPHREEPAEAAALVASGSGRRSSPLTARRSDSGRPSSRSDRSE